SFVTAFVTDSEPCDVEKVSGTPPRPLPSSSSTRAVMVAVPPVPGRLCGDAVSATLAAAAAPMLISIVSVAAPEKAVMRAMPERPSAISRVRARPPSVSASAGSKRPSVVTKVTTVPLWTGVPPAVVPPSSPPPSLPSVTMATISADPLTGTTFVVDTSVMVAPDGATRGILSHATVAAAHKASAAARSGIGRQKPEKRCGSMRVEGSARDSTCMVRGGQATRPVPGVVGPCRSDDGGFIMVALLVAMAVTAVWMAALLPAWRQQMQREKETELIFRGEAIARAIYLYRQRHGGTLPPDLDTLVEQRFLRRKYIDPITGEDFVLVGGATASGFGDGGLQG